MNFHRAVHLATLMLAMSMGASAKANSDWRFNVSLDGKRIGYHSFSLRNQGEERTLISRAQFNIHFLFLSAYRYVHEASEVWQGQCLKQLSARTDDNGKISTIRGEQSSDRFILESTPAPLVLDPCVQTFAYWNPTILQAERLLNPQTGEYIPVTIERLGVESLARGKYVEEAVRYRIKGESAKTPLQIDLWYSNSGQWLALESVTDGDRLLKYTLQ